MTTPMRSQYLRIKKRFPNTIVLFRLGDFYETFDDDAKVVSQVCDIVLTSRPVGKGQRVPLAGVPYHAVDTYLAKLITAGLRVAVVEQGEEMASRGLMQREVVRVVTPGTIVEPALLEDHRNNYLAAVSSAKGAYGLAYADITTGEFKTTQLTGPDALPKLLDELQRVHAAETLLGDSSPVAQDLGTGPFMTTYPEWHFDQANASRALLRHFGVSSLDGYGCSAAPLAICAAGAIIQYLEETQPAALSQLTSLATYSTSSYMILDPSTRRNLEITETIRGGHEKGSLLEVLDCTRTAMGSRLLRQRLSQPLLDRASLDSRLDAVQVFHADMPRRTSLRDTLRRIADLERLANRVVQGIARPRDLLALRDSLSAIPDLLPLLEALCAEEPELLPTQALDPCSEVVALIDQAIRDDPAATLVAGGVIARGFSGELDSILVTAREAKEWVAQLERAERQRTGIKSLKVGYNKVFGYYIEVTKPNLGSVPQEYVRKQTLVNSERFIVPDLREKEALILNAEERRNELERQIYQQVCEQIAAASPRILSMAAGLAEIDVASSLAEVAQRNRYVRPQLTAGNAIRIIAGRHPVVELSLDHDPFVPNDAHVTKEEAILIITGPNMSGKSTFLRQVALIVLMAQVGSFVPAESADIALVDRIFTRVGAQDEISAGQSTFMVEMVEAANILNHATSQSLLILDEIGRGTSTYDGISIAWAMVEYIHNHPRLQSKTLFATHYHELTELERLLPRVRNYNVQVVEEGDQVLFLHKIVPGGADRSYGIHVAELAGLPKPVIRRAQEILADLEEEVQRSPAASPKRVGKAAEQLTFLGSESPVVEELRALDVSSMSPLEAINKLYDLQGKARSE